ncbi:hypothetical protein UA08_01638 [Talaromyces atroroseus]|uniref:SAP domain-containing protein n=1 Tax=Talaromyces atroroseus TaxID=1441469 RepID=A0A1Q5Q9P3_TALAT|nr:hypothetical protein UA08_01638 [Talaromyces atroroseus]OKL62655.1 hypothetical protein UA08_01638 [Talaromyces atroroseus]
MRFRWATGLLVVLATSEAVGASNWFSRSELTDLLPVYNSWHETELERWLGDHDIPYPTPADRKDLEKLVKTNWNAKVQVPLAEVSETTSGHLSNVKEWIFDSWTESRLKAFLDRHGIPAPQPRRRDTLLRAARENYDTIAKKIGETAAYPGNWLYEEWTESDLKEWLDTHGWPAPQPTTRDRLIAAVRRQSRLASLAAKQAAASVSSSAAAAQHTLSEALFEAWSDSQLKKFLDEHGVKVPQGSKRNELIALARKNRKYLFDQASTVSASAASAYGAATSKAGNEYAHATDDAQLKAEYAFDAVVEKWSDSRLKAFLDARGVPVPQHSKRDELLAKVRLHKHKAATSYSAWTFDTWTIDNLKKYLSSANNKAAHKADATREELVRHAQEQYAKASKAGGNQYASVTSYLAQATAGAKKDTFNEWSESDLKKYLDSYGIPTYQGSQINELRAAVRRNAQYFHYGTSSPSETILARFREAINWLVNQLKLGAALGWSQGHDAAESAKAKAAQTTEKIREELTNPHPQSLDNLLNYPLSVNSCLSLSLESTMSADPRLCPSGQIYYPPRFPIQPPHEHISPNWLITVEYSAVEFTTERGFPDIGGYIFMRKAIDITRARNPAEIRLFQRIDSIETLSNLAGLPQIARYRIQICFQQRAAEMRGRAASARLDFWSLFHTMYIKDMMFFRTLLLRRYPGLMQDINWGFLLRDPSTDVAVMVYLWILGIWHSMQNRAAARLPILADQLRVLVPCQHYFGITE